MYLTFQVTEATAIKTVYYSFGSTEALAHKVRK